MEFKFRPEDEAFLKGKLDAGVWPNADVMAMYLVHLLREDDKLAEPLELRTRAMLDEVDEEDEGIDGPAFIREVREKYFGSDSEKRTA